MRVGFLKLIKVEFNKLKGTKLIPIFILFPLIFCSLGLMNVIRYKEKFFSNTDPWSIVYEQNAIFYGGLFFQIMIAVIVGAIVGVEFKNNNLKNMFTLPIKKEQVYISKLIVVSLMILLNVVIFIVFIAVSGLIIIKPDKIPLYVIMSPLISFVSSLPIVAIYYYLNIRLRNRIIPIILSICLVFPTMIINSSKLWCVFPFAFPSHLIMAGTCFYSNSYSIVMVFVTIVSFGLFTRLGIRYFRRMDVR
ncbi:ABC transporter permease [Clostridiaceae bacterium M8S5]|nr:ABC transporter permease [Clostridiaceae bacterium M8S5]